MKVKEVAVYLNCQDAVALPGESTMMDACFKQDLEEKAACKACPRRFLKAGAIAFEDLRMVDFTAKADLGSEANGLKTLDTHPACFHPDRAQRVG